MPVELIEPDLDPSQSTPATTTSQNNPASREVPVGDVAGESTPPIFVVDRNNHPELDLNPSSEPAAPTA